MHPFLEKILTSENATVPLVIDEGSALEVVTFLSGNHITSLDECQTGSIPGVSLYEKEIDKKHLSVKDIRSWIADLSEIPYEKKHIYILRDFDLATHEAMNASLKSLEEPPAYAIILLIVTNPESLLETIASRTFTIFRSSAARVLDSSILEAISDFHRGDEEALIKMLFSKKFEKEEALSLLLELAKNAQKGLLENIEEAITILFVVNETPRNILDKMLFAPR